MFIRIIAIALTLTFGTLQLFSQNAEEIIKKSMEKRGDYEAFKNLKSYKIKGKQTAMGMEIPFTFYYKAPDKMRQESKAMEQEQITGYDGKQMWQSAQGQTQAVPQQYTEQAVESLKQIPNFLVGPLADYKEKDKEIEFSGATTEDGRKAYTLKMEKNDGETYAYLDKNNYQLFKLFAQVENEKEKKTMDVEISFSDFKEVNGFSVPHKINVAAGEQKFAYIIDKIEVNPKLEDSLFSIPK